MKRCYTHKGFTLVELLIVIVVIGILSAMTMLAASEFVDSSKATKIISDLTQLKKAATAWYLDNYDKVIWATDGTKNGYKLNGKDEIHTYLNSHPEEIFRYMSNGFQVNNGVKGKNPENKNDYSEFYSKSGGFSVYMGNANTRLYVMYRISEDDKKKDQIRLREKLKGRAKSVGLLLYEVGKQPRTYNGENFVFMQVLTLEDHPEKRK